MLPQRQYYDETSLYREEEQELHLKVYTNNKNKKRTKRRHLRKLSPRQKLVCLFVVIFAMCLVYVSLEAKITQIGYSVNQLKADIAEAQEVNDRLMLEVEELSSPQRIAQYAGAEDGMVAVDENNILYADIKIADTKAASDIAADENGGKTQAEASADLTQTESQKQAEQSSSAKTENNNAAKTKKNTVIGAFSSLMDKLSAARVEAADLAK